MLIQVCAQANLRMTTTQAVRLARRVAETVTKLLVPHALLTASKEHRIVKYSPRYRLAFTLLNEDASSGQAALSWDVREAVEGSFHLRSNFISTPHPCSISAWNA